MLLIRIELFVQTMDMKKRQFFKAFFCLKVLFKAKIFNLMQMNFDAKKRQKSIIIFTLAPKTKYMKYCIMRLF